MAITYRNLASHLVILQLNNGDSVYLAPGQTSEVIPSSQINGNDKLAKLVRNNLLMSSEADEPSTKAKGRKK